MGLYVVRRLVEVHGGRLRMTSDGGEINVEVDMWAAELPLPTADPTMLPRLPDLPRLRAEGLVEREPFIPAPSGPPLAVRRPRWDQPGRGYPNADEADLTGLGGAGLGGPRGRASAWPADDLPLDRSG
jgi:signal transduction histidine kinase